MTRTWKEKSKSLAQTVAAYALMYAFLPLCALGMIVLMLFVGRHGPHEVQAYFAEIGTESMAAAVGAEIEPSARREGFYFLSSELFFPVKTDKAIRYGTASYFSFQESSPKPAPKPEILYDALPAGAVPVVKADLSSRSPYINTTKYSIDLQAARARPFPCKTSSDEPLVLVLHTHATECYFEDKTNLSDFAPEGVESYFVEGETLFRCSDPTKSVVQVGKVFCDVLTQQGIPTLHCTTMHDKDDFNEAYVNSAETVKAYLKQYPSIQYVIDLHRDSVVRGEAWVKTHAEIDGKESAQVMLVVGTNQNGRHPNWLENLTVATAFKDTMDEVYPSLSRSMYLRTARFNQEFSAGCMLLEVGSAANTLAEAECAARYAAECFVKMLRDRQ